MFSFLGVHVTFSLLSHINALRCLADAAAEDLGSSLRPLCGFLPALPLSDQKETSKWINIKILFPGMRLGNILPSNGGLGTGESQARNQLLNYPNL